MQHLICAVSITTSCLLAEKHHIVGSVGDHDLVALRDLHLLPLRSTAGDRKTIALPTLNPGLREPLVVPSRQLSVVLTRDVSTVPIVFFGRQCCSLPSSSFKILAFPLYIFTHRETVSIIL
ncbi:hypothetical protein BKA82DRAFT_31069 [Pisolithus tinctorius]|uniref:Uncharacterized protein n=1 Tax=Pisolithus tinctorius Marx 270 TaxID=870435 RepID=A0A0C3NU20_PISTI|nr:hypothetical protein BKA82DRAFT_31069 [Pisolithus tinctorius]KIN98743.1 hypothetical protein M404DRAFT_31069 [Pisolithus tinctorius Marx 270]